MTSLSHPTKRRLLLFALLLVVIGLVVKGITVYSAADANAGSAPPAPVTSVSVQTINPKSIRVWSSFSDRMQAVDYAAIRPEVSGRITEIRFKDGDTVKPGAVLMVIDPEP